MAWVTDSVRVSAQANVSSQGLCVARLRLTAVLEYFNAMDGVGVGSAERAPAAAAATAVGLSVQVAAIAAIPVGSSAHATTVVAPASLLSAARATPIGNDTYLVPMGMPTSVHFCGLRAPRRSFGTIFTVCARGNI